ncbi:MAG: hypothetical protein VX947_03510, partial [Chloroflexota bacterium]|nr:hypothetical protein [Chloroflexota bacterium]
MSRRKGHFIKIECTPKFPRSNHALPLAGRNAVQTVRTDHHFQVATVVPINFGRWAKGAGTVRPGN